MKRILFALLLLAFTSFGQKPIIGDMYRFCKAYDTVVQKKASVQLEIWSRRRFSLYPLSDQF